MNVPVWKLPSPRRTRLVGLPIAARVPKRGGRHGYSPTAEEAKENWLFAIIFRYIFFFFFPVEKLFRSNGPIGEMADWRRFARVTIIYIISDTIERRRK